MMSFRASCATRQLTQLESESICRRDRSKPVRYQNIVGRSLHFFWISVLVLLYLTLLIGLSLAKNEPSVGEDDNSVPEFPNHPQLMSRKDHCDCPPKGFKASSDFSTNPLIRVCFYRVGTEVKYSCWAGHEKKYGYEHLECVLKEGQAVWDHDPLRCEITSCGDPGIVEFGTREGNSFIYNSHIRYRCHPGYTPVGTPFLRCNETGQWNRKKPTCKLIQCPYINKLDPNLYLQYSDIDRVVDSVVHFQCKIGYQLDDENNAKRVCNWDGNWTGKNPTCVQKFCQNPAPNSLPPGVVLLPKKDHYLVGESIHYYCVTSNEYERVQCLADGTLQGTSLNCPRPQATHCPPIELDRGHVTSSSNDKFVIGARLTFQCDYNYKLTEPKWIVCQNNGEWTNKPPHCVDLDSAFSSFILSTILTCVIFTIILILIIWFVVLFRWRQKQNQRRKYRKYFLNYEFQHDKTYMPPNANQEMRLFFQSTKQLSVPFTDL